VCVCVCVRVCVCMLCVSTQQNMHVRNREFQRGVCAHMHVTSHTRNIALASTRGKANSVNGTLGQLDSLHNDSWAFETMTAGHLRQ